MILRHDQLELLARTQAAFVHARAVVMQAPTGAGKTTMACEIIRRALAKDRRIAFLARLTVLIDDTHTRLVASGIRAGIIQAARKPDVDAPVQVASLDTLASRGTVPPADLVILDECHAAPSPDVMATIALYPASWILGLTATPCRADDAPLRPPFDALVQGPSVRELIALGALVPIDLISTRMNLDAGVQCAEPMDAYMRHTPNGRAVVFAASVEHATRIYDEARTRGVTSIVVTAKSKREDRARARELLAAGPCVVSCVDVFREGWDAPACDTIILARGFSHVGSYLQAIGRGSRAAPGKSRCTVLDLCESWQTCGLPDEDREWSLGERSSRRTESIEAVRRCLECGAVYRDAVACPRCGTSRARTKRVARVLSAAERMEKIEAIADPIERDRALLQTLRRQAFAWAGPDRADHIARGQFRKRHGRAPLV